MMNSRRNYTEKSNLIEEGKKIGNGKKMLLSKCAKCRSIKSGFFKNQEEKGILINLGIKKPFSKVPLLDDILF